MEREELCAYVVKSPKQEVGSPKLKIVKKK